MKQITLEKMEMVEGGKFVSDSQCDRVASYMTGVGIGLCFSTALLPLGIVIGAAGALSSLAC